jgi:hypothetical protein
MPLNWPPASAPSWPPPELETSGLSTSDLLTLARILLALGFTHAAPTNAERIAHFRDARCDEGHTVTGRMLISPSGVRYPVAVCMGATHRDVLVQFPPYYLGFNSANFTW